MMDERAEGGVDQLPSLTPTNASFFSTNDHWRVNENLNVELKIYEVQFEIWRGDLRLIFYTLAHEILPVDAVWSW